MTRFEESEIRCAVADAKNVFCEHEPSLLTLRNKPFTIRNISAEGNIIIGPRNVIIHNNANHFVVFVECEYEGEAEEAFLETLRSLIRR